LKRDAAISHHIQPIRGLENWHQFHQDRITSEFSVLHTPHAAASPKALPKRHKISFGSQNGLGLRVWSNDILTTLEGTFGPRSHQQGLSYHCKSGCAWPDSFSVGCVSLEPFQVFFRYMLGHSLLRAQVGRHCATMITHRLHLP
jgi:hypothetical protein